GDPARRLGPRAGGESAYFLSVNRGKKGITLDLSREEGQGLARALAERADVLVENFAPGTMARLGLDYGRLSVSNPRLVYASISGFGQDGPYAHRPALDIVVQAMGGIMSVTGEPGGPPQRPGVSLGDSIAGLFAALAIVAALHERDRTGQGRYIDMSMLDCQVTMMENALARYFATGEAPGPLGSRHPAATPFQAFATRDGHIVVAILSDDGRLWPRFCAVIGHPELAEDPRFADGWGRTQNYELLRPVMDKAMRSRSSREWLDEFSAQGIACGPVNTVDAVVRDPQVRHRGMIAEVLHGESGAWRVANTPFRISGFNCGPQGAAPGLGEQSEEVLRDMLGIPVEEIARLRAEGVV
ncbi:MAG: CoA transferase, partial [Chloroflexi bacterium]|nr:CoA transferase [Chloroflexota bacterium]